MCVWRQNVNRDSIFCSVSDPFCCESKITIKKTNVYALKPIVEGHLELRNHLTHWL